MPRISIEGATPPCNYDSITFDSAGNAIVTCGGAAPVPAPQPAPTPAPTPSPSPPPPSGNVIIHDLLTEGSNNYIFDGDRNAPGPQGTIQALRLPMLTSDGRAVSAAKFIFTDYIVYTPESLQVEIAFSRTPGDFTFYKSEAAAYRFMPGQEPYTPYGGIFGPVATLAFGPTLQYDSAAIPANEQWYLNWRIVGGCGVSGRNCGQVLVWHRLY